MSWDDLNRAGPCGHVFASGAYLDLVAQTFRGRLEECSVEVDGAVRAGVRVLVRRSPLAKRVVVPGYTAYSAILLERMPTEAETHGRTSALEGLLAELERRYAGVDLNLPPSIIDVRTFSWRKWAVQPLYTYRVKLDKETVAMQNWSGSAARIAQRESEEYDVVEVGPDTVAGKSVESYKKHDRRPPLGRSQLTKLLEQVGGELDLSLLGARNRASGEIESAVAILRHGKVAYYWIAGGGRGSSMTVMLGKIFRNLSDDGVETFDFVGANTDSIAEFKRKFGGRLTTYFRAVWRRGPLIATEDALKSIR